MSPPTPPWGGWGGQLHHKDTGADSTKLMRVPYMGTYCTKKRHILTIEEVLGPPQCNREHNTSPPTATKAKKAKEQEYLE